MSEIEQALGKGVVKSTKPKRMFFRKIVKGLVTSLLVASIFVSGALLFTGCSSKDPSTNNNAPEIVTPVDPEPEPEPEPEPPIVIETPTTITEFLTEHKADATAFAQNNFKSAFTGTDEVLSESWSFGTNADGKLTSVELRYTTNSEKNERSLEKIKIDFNTPVDIDAILDEEISASDLAGNVSRTTIFTFDAKENYVKAELGNALFNAVKLEDGQNFFKEVESTNVGTRKFKVSHTDTATQNTTVYEVEVKTESEEDLIANLGDSTKTTVATLNTILHGENQIKISEYAQEKFQPESVDDLLENYENYVHTALNNNFFAKINKTCFGRSFDENKLFDTEWRIITNNENKVTGFKYITKYASNSIDILHKVAEIVLAEPLALNDFTDDNANIIIPTAAQNATYTSLNTYGYAAGEQDGYQAFVNKIFEVKGMGAEVSEGGERFCADDGAFLHDQLGETRTFKILQVTDEGINQYTLIIKSSSSIEEYINKLNSENNYTFNTKNMVEIKFDGSKLEYKPLTSQLEDEDEMEL